LPPEARDIALHHCLHDDGKKIRLHAAVVMPDHVHLLFTQLVDRHGSPYGLAEILTGIKGTAAHRINQRLRRRGHVWQDESFDHVLRSDESVRPKASYLSENPVRKGLVGRAEDYPWSWQENLKPNVRCFLAQPRAAVPHIGPQKKSGRGVMPGPVFLDCEFVQNVYNTIDGSPKRLYIS
jgi:REP element-mobilizing transposase RayT